MLGHFNILHPSTCQEQHLQVEQVGRQVAGGLTGTQVGPHSEYKKDNNCVKYKGD